MKNYSKRCKHCNREFFGKNEPDVDSMIEAHRKFSCEKEIAEKKDFDLFTEELRRKGYNV